MQTIYIHQYAMDCIHSSSVFYVLTNFSLVTFMSHKHKNCSHLQDSCCEVTQWIKLKGAPKMEGSKTVGFFWVELCLGTPSCWSQVICSFQISEKGRPKPQNQEIIFFKMRWGPGLDCVEFLASLPPGMRSSQLCIGHCGQCIGHGTSTEVRMTGLLTLHNDWTSRHDLVRWVYTVYCIWSVNMYLSTCICIYIYK